MHCVISCLGWPPHLFVDQKLTTPRSSGLIKISRDVRSARRTLFVTEAPALEFSLWNFLIDGSVFGVEGRYHVLADVDVYKGKQYENMQEMESDKRSGQPPVGGGATGWKLRAGTILSSRDCPGGTFEFWDSCHNPVKIPAIPFDSTSAMF